MPFVRKMDKLWYIYAEKYYTTFKMYESDLQVQPG